jgi:hypothetical protein
MLSWRWSGAIVLTASAAAMALLWAGGGGRRDEVDAAPNPASPGLRLTGFFEAAGVDPRRCQARCVTLRLDSAETVHVAELDADGRFVLEGLADVDYRVEIVVSRNPALVLARVDFVRPGGQELVIQADPLQIFRPEASPDPER